MMRKIGFISLGCDKNRVDLEKMMFRIKNANLELVEDLNEANIILVNTCAFIAKAREESISIIMELVKNKNKNNLEKIIITGCLSERYKEELIDAIPELDAVVKLEGNTEIDKIIYDIYSETLPKTKKVNSYDRVLSNSNHYAFLKIADGCNNCCAYCTIPRIRGRYKSEKMEDLLLEAENLVMIGVKELILVAQDTTRYGVDLYKEPKLVELLQKLSKIEGLERIRIHYCYPEMIDDKLLHEIEINHKICGYLDIPLQHIDNKILKLMNRRSTEQDIRQLISKIRSLKRKIAIRSTFIVGFPNESRRSFLKLCEFLKDVKLDNVGFFAYSKEDKTSAAYMDKQIPNFIKNHRLKYIQKIQAQISSDLQRNKIGLIQNIMIDRFDQNNGLYYGRDEYNSIDVDYETEIDSPDLKIGQTYKVKIIDFDNNLFKGEIV